MTKAIILSAQELPSDLIERGYKLIIRAPDRMFAVSSRWGCTGTKTAIHEAIKEARDLVRFLEWLSKQRS